MAQQHLGERDPYMIRVARDVNVKALAAAAGYSNVSRYGADLFAIQAGRPDLVIGPDRQKQEDTLPISA